jgi:deaminated glutathione amidase
LAKSALSQQPKNKLRVGILQTTSIDSVDANLSSVFKALAKLKNEKCDLICLPENALYLRLDRNKKIEAAFTLKEKFWAQFSEFATDNNVTILIGSIAFKKGKKSTNATVLIAPRKKPKIVYEKIHLFDVDVKGAPPSRESDFFARGRLPKTIQVCGWRIGLSICYDVRFSELYSMYAKKKVDLIMVPSAFLVPTGRAHWHALLRARAIESQAFVVAAAQSGGHKNTYGQTRETFGHSLVVGPWGEVQLDMGNSGESQAVIDLSIEEIQKVRVQIPMAQHRHLRP